MRKFSPLLVVLLAVAAFAQSDQSTPLPQQPGPANNYGIPPAPKPGHPLDPGDVAVLTGKTGNAAPAPQQYMTPQIYYSYPTGGSMFSQSTVGNAFGQQPDFSMGFGNDWGFRNNFGFANNRRRSSGFGFRNTCTGYPDNDFCNSAQIYNGYTNFNGSQFANVTTEATPFHLSGRRRPGFGPTFFFGNRTPGFGFINRWRPNLWSSPGPHVQAPTGVKSSPGLRP